MKTMSRIYRNDMLFLATANFKHMPDDILKHISGYLPRSWRAPLPCRRELALIDFIEKGAKKHRRLVRLRKAIYVAYSDS